MKYYANFQKFESGLIGCEKVKVKLANYKLEAYLVSGDGTTTNFIWVYDTNNLRWHFLVEIEYKRKQKEVDSKPFILSGTITTKVLKFIITVKVVHRWF